MKHNLLFVLFVGIVLSCALFTEILADGGVFWQDNGIQICSYFSTWPINAFDEKRSAIIIWRDDRAPDNNIYGQRVDIDGNILWQQDGVPVAITPYTVDNPGGVICDGKGGAITAWGDNRQWWITDGDIYAQRLDSLGNALWGGAGTAICVADSVQYKLKMISDSKGGSIILWVDSRNGYFYNKDIYAQRIDSSGIIQWQYNGVPVCTLENHQEMPDIVEDNEGGAIVVWRDERNVEPGVYCQRLDSLGTLLWDSTGISITSGPWLHGGGLLCSSGSAFLILFGDKRGVYWNIYAQRIRADGSIMWDSSGIPVCPDSAQVGQGVILSDYHGGAVIIWEDGRYGNHDLYAQRIDSLGQLYWQPNGIHICTAADSLAEGIYLRAASDEQGGVICAWSPRDTPEDENIFAQHVDSSGVCQWDSNGLPVCTAPSLQRVTGICEDGVGGAIISWSDGRHGNFGNIYAQRVGDIQGVEEEKNPRNKQVPQISVFPNPFMFSTTITVRLLSEGEVSETEPYDEQNMLKNMVLNIFDVTGRLIRSFPLSTSFYPLRASIKWDGNDMNGTNAGCGIYYLKLIGEEFEVEKAKMIIKIQ